MDLNFFTIFLSIFSSLVVLPRIQAYDIPLGFLIPSVSNDSAVTPQLALEWRSAAQVALRFLRPQYGFRVVPFYADSGCSQDAAEEAAKLLVETYKVVAVVGPACSEAVIGANKIFKPKKIPFISYAATAQILSNRTLYPTFYRTVYGDHYQSAAIGSVVKILKMKTVFIFYSNDAYGQGLYDEIITHLSNTTVIKFIAVTSNLTDDYSSSFSQIGLKKSVANNQTLVIFAVSTRISKGLFKTALKLGLLKDSSLWYLGTDGVTALDLIGIGENLTELSSGLQGQLGVSPYFNNLQKSSRLVNFTNYWHTQTYNDLPGLITFPLGSLRVNRTRSYVEHLIDATWIMHEIFYILTTTYRENVTPARVIRILKTLQFKGCSGIIQFDPSTGSRRENVEGGAKYTVVTLKRNVWRTVSVWTRKDRKKFTMPTNKYARPVDTPSYTIPSSYLPSPPVAYIDVNLNMTSYVVPPPVYPSPPPPSPSPSPPTPVMDKSSGGGQSKGRIVGFVFLALVLTSVAVIGLVWYYRRRKAYLEQPFVRML